MCVFVHACPVHVCECVYMCARTCVHEHIEAWGCHQMSSSSVIFFNSLNLEFTTPATLATQQTPVPPHLSLAPPELRLQVRITTLRFYAGPEIRIQDLMLAQSALCPLNDLPRCKLLSSEGSSCVLDSRLLGNDAICEYFLPSHKLYFHCFNTVFQSLNFSF